MKKQIVFGILICFLIASFVSAYEENYTLGSGSESSFLEISQLKYEPYPVNPGEYFDLWIKAQWVGTGNPRDATFELLPEYPFSLDTNENAVRSFGKINTEPIVMKYKVRVSDNAVEGINELDLRYNTDGSDNYWFVKAFDIQVADAQTDFDLVIQESSGSDVSIAIANIGKNTANSLIVRIPEQDSYRVSGTNGQMVGNLDSGDYTIVSFSLTSVSRGSESNSLQVQLDYTDSIGKRRSVIKEVNFVSSSPVALNATGVSGGNFQGGNFTNQSTSSSIFKSFWFWIVIVLLAGGGYYYYRKYPEKVKGLFSKSKKDKSGNKAAPEWVSAERKKK